VAKNADLVVTLSVNVTNPPSVLLAAYHASGSMTTPLWQKEWTTSISQNLEVSEDGTILALGVSSLVNGKNVAYVLIMQGFTGKEINRFSCNGTNTNNLLALDTTGRMVAYDCLPNGLSMTTVFVQPSLSSNKSDPFLSTQAIASTGTGFALSRGGAFFAHGAMQTHVFKLVGQVYHLLFVRDPIPVSIPRLLEAIVFQNEASNDGPLLATGYFKIDTVHGLQQSFLEVFDMKSARVSTPIWRYFLANSTSNLQGTT
jgi:hypothetical protein